MNDQQYDAACRKVSENCDAFEADRERLRGHFEGKWLIYHDGVRGVYLTENAACSDAVWRFGADAGFAIVQCVERKVYDLPSSLRYSPSSPRYR